MKQNRNRAARTGFSRTRSKNASTGRIEFARTLVPVDFTPESAKSLRYASAVSKAADGKVLLLHVTPPIRVCVDCGYGSVSRQGPDLAAERRDHSRLRRFAARHLSPDCLENILIRSGKPAQEIIQTAVEQHADLIVLCAHDKAKTASIASHDVIEEVSRCSRCPVLVVHQDAE